MDGIPSFSPPKYLSPSSSTAVKSAEVYTPEDDEIFGSKPSFSSTASSVSSPSGSSSSGSSSSVLSSLTVETRQIKTGLFKSRTEVQREVPVLSQKKIEDAINPYLKSIKAPAAEHSSVLQSIVDLLKRASASPSETWGPFKSDSVASTLSWAYSKEGGLKISCKDELGTSQVLGKFQVNVVPRKGV